MGNWNINIQGVGCHHNGKPEIDADLAAIEFVAKLREQGHAVEVASFTSGGKMDLLEASKPVEKMVRVKIDGTSYDMPDICTYEIVKRIAGWDGVGMPSTPSIIYRNARFGKDGILHPGRTIEVCDGTVFSISHTGNG